MSVPRPRALRELAFADLGFDNSVRAAWVFDGERMSNSIKLTEPGLQRENSGRKGISLMSRKTQREPAASSVSLRKLF